MPSRLKRILLPLATALLLQGCGLFRDKPPEYVAADEGRPLKVPDDLDELVFVRPVEITVPPMRTPAGDELSPGPPRAVSTGGGGETNAYLAWSAEGVHLRVKDSPDSVARRLGYAIERSGMKLLERDPDGAHEFEYVHVRVDDRGFFKKLFFWWSDRGPDYSGAYRTRVEPHGDETRVFLEDAAGQPANTGAAEHILGIFMERLG